MSTSITIVEEEKNKKKNMKSWYIFIVIIIWFVLAAFSVCFSILCFSKSGTDKQKVWGMVLAFLVGPFYFIYYYFTSISDKNKYCKITNEDTNKKNKTIK